MALLIKILLVLICVYYIIKWTSRFLLNYFFKKVQERVQEQFGQFEQQQQEEEKPEGQIDVQFPQSTTQQQEPANKQFKDDAGDYIDFEELSS